MNHLWPLTASTGENGELLIDGLSVGELARKYETPLYIYDEATLRRKARSYRSSLRAAYKGSSQVAYASKAYLCTAIAQIFAGEKLDLDVVSGGELFVALRAGFPPASIHFHGNNKSLEEVDQALEAGVGRIVVDNFRELGLVEGLAQARRMVASVWLRLAPGVQAHTHSHIQTGQEDTKFGFSIASGDAERAVTLAMQAEGLRLVGLHAHIGSQIYEPEALAEAAERLLAFAAEMRARHGFELEELSPGGGWGVPMTEADRPAEITRYVCALAGAITAACERHALPLPHLVLEPGRSLVAQAGIAVYSVGSSKTIPGVRQYVSLDGGMADNIRPALYEAKYTARRGDGRDDLPLETVTLAGKYCESGDVLIRDISLPHLDAGDLVAVPMAGAYALAMASNYNMALRPAVVLVGKQGDRLIQRREVYDDLVDRDEPYAPLPESTRRKPVPRQFVKYHGLGNDYLVLDSEEWPECPPPEDVRAICDRNTGVGADGIIWASVSNGSMHVRMFNPDGSEFEKSGNGLRIAARYTWDRRGRRPRDIEIRTQAGPVFAHVLNDDGTEIAMKLGKVSFSATDLGLATTKPELIEEELEVEGKRLWVTAVNMGNPHCVVFAVDGRGFEDMEELMMLARSLGPALERLPLYPNRTNVQFARVVNRHRLEIGIWERGAGYTLASGTSSCAAAAAAIRTGRCDSQITVVMPGGEQLVEIDDAWNVRLTGRVERVCRGEWDPDV